MATYCCCGRFAGDPQLKQMVYLHSFIGLFDDLNYKKAFAF
jgi:hypothetical protein